MATVEDVFAALKEVWEALVPTYTYACKECGKQLTLTRPIIERDEPQVGCLCGGKVERVPDAPYGKVQGGTPRFYK